MALVYWLLAILYFDRAIENQGVNSVAAWPAGLTALALVIMSVLEIFK